MTLEHIGVLYTHTAMVRLEGREMNDYTVIRENDDGECDTITVRAASGWDAMAASQRDGWHPVDVEQA